MSPSLDLNRQEEMARALGATPGQFLQARNSTPGPYGVPAWDDNMGLDMGALSDLFGASANAQQLATITPRSAGKAPTPTPSPSLSIGNPSVEQQSEGFVDYAVNKRAVSEFNAKLKAAQDKANAALKSAQGKFQTGRANGSYTPEGYGYYGTTGIDGTKGSASYGLQPEFWAALGAANAAMKAAGLGTFSITDGWRSYSNQVIAKKKKGKLAATPGNSVHGIGYAADLGLTNAQWNWLMQNGASYGLWAFPGVDSQSDAESWHWQLAPTLANPPWSS